MADISDLRYVAHQTSMANAETVVKSHDFAATLDSGLAAYPTPIPGAVYAPAQHPDWVAAWRESTTLDGFVLSLRDGDDLVLRLALETEKQGPVRIARFVGASHANGNFPALVRQLGALGDNAIPALCEAMAIARPDVDMIRLERMVGHLDGVENPLIAPGAITNPNVRLTLDLTPGFDAILASWSSKRLKRHRYRARKFEEAGGYRHIVAATEADVDRFLSAFFDMKEARFRSQGIDDPFASAEVRAFFRNLFVASLGDRTYTLEALEVGGELRAISAHSRSVDRVVCDFVGFAEDELTAHSPGEFLFYLNIEDAAASGVATYDFGTGDEPYKRVWSNAEYEQYDLVIPLNARGAVFARWLRLRSALVSSLKGNQRLWALAKQARRKLRGA